MCFQQKHLYAKHKLVDVIVQNIYHDTQSAFIVQEKGVRFFVFFFFEILKLSSRMMLENVMQFHNLEYKLRRLSLYIG